MADGIEISADIAGIAPVCDQLERYLFPTAADPQRWMRFLYTFGLVDGTIDGIVLAGKDRGILRPHPVNDLDPFTKHAHSFARLRESVSIRPPFMLIPAGAESEIEPAVTRHIDCRRDLGKQRRIAIPVARNHLAHLDARGVAGQGGCNGTAFEGNFHLGRWNRVAGAEHPD